MYKALGITKQSFHQHHNRLLKRMELEAYLQCIVAQVREDHPSMGCRDMYYLIQPESMGRDQFEQYCLEAGFLIARVKNYKRTTDSSGVKRFENLAQGLTLDAINQLWASDITYFQIGHRFYYLTFIIDCYSRRIIGHSSSIRLLTSHTTIVALKSALRTRRNQNIEGVILHSDGGGQYYADAFLTMTKTNKIQNSMCVYPWENPYAERINGVIKNNYLVHRSITNFNQLIREVDRAVNLYNHQKPHKGLNRLTPVHFENVSLGKANIKDCNKEYKLTQ